MTVYRKISLHLLMVFVLLYVLGALIYTQVARHDIQREMNGVSGLAANIGAPHMLPESVAHNVRHLTPAGDYGRAPQNMVPKWFWSLVVSDGKREEINGWQLNPADEVEEIWEGFLLVSLAYAIGMALCFLALYVQVRSGLRTLSRLETAMKEVSEGRLTSRLPAQEEKELDALVGRFNSMSEALGGRAANGQSATE